MRLAVLVMLGVALGACAPAATPTPAAKVPIVVATTVAPTPTTTGPTPTTAAVKVGPSASTPGGTATAAATTRPAPAVKGDAGAKPGTGAASTPAAKAEAGAKPGAGVQAELPAGVLRIATGDGRSVDVRIEVAADAPSRERGLMFRESLAADAGMLFVFQGDTDGPFWMKDTLIPLSIAFIGSDRRIVSIKDMQPRSLDMVHSDRPYRYALEVNQGFFARNGVKVGDAADFRL